MLLNPRLFLICLALVFALVSVAQKEAAIWHFGNYAGIDFNSGSPVVIHGGKTNSMEGVA